MTLEILNIGGYNEVGKNMTAVKYNDEIVVCDMGIYIPAIIGMANEERLQLSSDQLIEIGAIPNDKELEKVKNNVKAIVSSHCHLDHIGAIPFLAAKYRCPIIGSPYTIQVLRSILKDERLHLPNKLVTLTSNSKFNVSKNIQIELVNVTHSTLQATIIAIHTPEGIVIYANDFKLDNTPVLGKKPNYERFRQLAEKGIKCLIMESLYAHREGKTPSEKIAKEMLKEVILTVSNDNKDIFITTFASHIARLKTAIEVSRKMGREVIILGRSMQKYILAAEELHLIKFSDKVKIARRRAQVESLLKRVAKNRGKYVVICTGNQGEPGSILDRISKGELDFKFSSRDQIIFSCKTIPQKENIEQRERLEKTLKSQGVRIFKDIHVSGHASKEDLRDFIELLKPKHIIPAHGSQEMETNLLHLAEEEGYIKGKTVHLMSDGQKIILK